MPPTVTIIDSSGVKVSENMTVLGPVVLGEYLLPDLSQASLDYARVMAAGEGGKWNVETNEIEGLELTFHTNDVPSEGDGHGGYAVDWGDWEA